MPTIIEMGAQWTISAGAAGLLEKKGYISECIDSHLNVTDRPVYHRSQTAPADFGYSTISDTILRAEQEIMLAKHDEVKN